MKNVDTSSHILDLAKKLITVPSTSVNGPAIKKVLEVAKQTLGTNFPVETFEHNGVPSLLVRNTLKRPKRFKVILNAHLDVVPGEKNTYKPYVKNGKLYGRGAYDMKSAAAVMILLFKEIAEKVGYPLGLQITTDEEIGGMDGTKHQIDKGVRADFVITGEGTNLRAIHQSKGIMRLKLTASGKASHSAFPWLGDNAIIKLHEAIGKILREYPLPKKEAHTTTVNVTHIGTGNSTEHTVTPDHCEAMLDVRYVARDEFTILPAIKSLLPKGVTHEIIHASHIHNTDAQNMFIKLLESASHKSMQHKLVLANAHGTSDVRHFTEVECDGVEFGPIGGGHHYKDEHVEIKSLDQYYKILKEFLQSIN